MRTIEQPNSLGPATMQVRCTNVRCAALLEIYETDLKREKGDRPFDPDWDYVTCPHCRKRISVSWKP